MLHRFSVFLLLTLLALPACTHLKGVVLDERGQKPVPDAVFTVGRPDGIAMYQKNKVDQKGRFDFYIPSTDTNNLYVWDAKGNPQLTVRKIHPMEINDNMVIHLRQSEFAE